MRILFCAHDFPPQVGGIQTYSYEVAKGLAVSGEDITVLTTSYPGEEKFDREQNFPIIRVKNKLKLYFTFFFLLKRKKIEKIMVAHRADFSGLASLANKLCKIDYYVAAHGGEVLLPWREKSIKKNFRRARRILAASRFTTRELVRMGVPEDKITIIGNGVDTGRFNPEVDCSDVREKFSLSGRKIILTVSHLVKRKGHAKVIEALPEVLKKVPQALYLIVGEGQEKENLKQLSCRYGVEKQVIFAGFVPDAELPGYYNISDLFIMPSYEIRETGDFEGYGIAFLEANAFGKPVIGGRSGGIEDAVIDGETGLLVDPLSRDEVAGALIRLLTDEKLAIELGRKGRERIEREMNWPMISQKVLRELKK